MIGSIVLPSQSSETQKPATQPQPSSLRSAQRMDPLSEVLAMMKPQVSVSGAFALQGEMAIHFPAHQGIKCYAMLSGECWLVVEGVSDPVLLHAGDCFLLPRGLPFRLATDLSLEPVHYTVALAQFRVRSEAQACTAGARTIGGGHFTLTGDLSGRHADMLLHAIPPIVHIRRESDRAAMRWSLERLREELSNPQPGSSLITQQLAWMMLIQALRVHLTDAAAGGSGWLSALVDKQMSIAIASIHNNPGHPWTVQSLAECVGMSRSVFALRFRETVGVTPVEYLTRWRMLLAADRLKNSSDGLLSIAQSLGYDSDSAFGKAFRRIMGCSPRQYTRS